MTTNFQRPITNVLAAALVLASAAALSAADWPQWRGPQRDGTGVAFTEPARWPEQLTQRWKIEVGVGHASPVLVGTTIYLHTRRGESEIVSAIDAGTGKVIWATPYAAPYKMQQAAVAHGPGPKSTPAVAGGRVFTLGISGILTALDATSGRVLWQHAAPPVTPTYGTGTSPIVDGAIVIAHVGGHDKGALTAFDAATGAERWKWAGDGPGYASPIIATLGGVRQLVTQSQNRVLGVAAESGQLLWELPLKTPFVQNVVTPVVYKDTVIYSGLANPTIAVRPVLRDGRWTTEKIWENEPNGSMYMSSPVLIGDTVYGMSNLDKGHFFAIDARTGKTLWATRGREAENSAIVAGGGGTNGVLFALKNDAELMVVRPNPAAFQEVRSYTVADSPTWAHPLISGTRLFIKDENHLIAWSL